MDHIDPAIIQKNNKLLSSNTIIDGNPDFQRQQRPMKENGFSTITKNKNRWWRCTQMTGKEKNILRCICIISNTRYQSLSDEEKKNLKYHDHVYPSIKTILTQIPAEKKPIEHSIQMTHALCKFAAGTNSSISLVVSKQMKDLLTAAITWGRQFPDADIEETFDANRKSFTKQFLCFADNLKDYQINFLEKYIYVSIQIDAGKLGSKNYFESTISNFYSKTSPVHFSSDEYFAGTTEAYKNSIINIINELTKQKKFIISAIVADNLRVQWSAMKDIQENLLNDPEEKSFLILPCSCHNISLGLNDSITTNPVLAEAQKSIIHFSSIFRKKSVTALFKKSCPEYCATRWNCIYDISEWIIKNFLRLDAFFHDPVIKLLPQLSDVSSLVKTIYIEAPLIVTLFAPFKVISKIFEGDSIPMSNIFPYTLSAINKGRSISSFCAFTANVYKSIETAVSKRIFHNESSKFLYLMFIMTPIGRQFETEILRCKDTWDQIDCEEFCTKYFNVEINSTLIQQAKIMLDSRSIFRTKFEKLNALHNSPDFEFIESEEEQNIRKEKEETIKRLKNSQNSNGFAKLQIQRLERELQHPIRFLNEKQLLNHNDEEVSAPLDEPLTNDFVSVNEQLPKKQISNNEIAPSFFNENTFGVPQRYDPQFWNSKKSILFSENECISQEEEDDSETLLNDNEKLQSYFEDFELPEDYIDTDISFHEDQVISSIINVCNIYKLNSQLVIKVFLEKWRNTSWDDKFEMYSKSYQSSFDFWNHFKNYGTREEKEFAELGLRLACILASEASVERVFSSKRPVTTGKFNASSTTLANARLAIKWFANQSELLPNGV